MQYIDEWIRRLLAPTALFFVIFTIWILAWCKSVEAEADKKYWPPLPVPVDYHNPDTVK